LAEYLSERKRCVDATLEHVLPAADGAARTVAEAMRYAVLAGGKRLRPILALAAHQACGGDAAAILEPACALELVHTYSLIHDDLPPMDDDDLRRGRPSVHRQFGEARAILAGDALLTLAFEILCSRPAGEASAVRRGDAAVTVARAAGLDGMIGGQIADLEAEGREVTAETLRWIHRRKTGALIAAGCEIGALHAGAAPERREAVAEFGRSLGLAFQIADDLLDRTGSRERLGKTPGKDERSGKATYPALFGIDASRRAARDLIRDATRRLRAAGVLTPALESLADYAVSRTA
jgi:geranylgeranyl diphosphate synthase type II